MEVWPHFYWNFPRRDEGFNPYPPYFEDSPVDDKLQLAGFVATRRWREEFASDRTYTILQGIDFAFGTLDVAYQAFGYLLNVQMALGEKRPTTEDWIKRTDGLNHRAYNVATEAIRKRFPEAKLPDRAAWMDFARDATNARWEYSIDTWDVPPPVPWDSLKEVVDDYLPPASEWTFNRSVPFTDGVDDSDSDDDVEKDEHLPGNEGNENTSNEVSNITNGPDTTVESECRDERGS